MPVWIRGPLNTGALSIKEKGATMELSRRDFLKASGVGVGGLLVFKPFRSDTATPSQFRPAPQLHKRIGETSTICAYCAGGCGVLIAADKDKLVSVEGWADHPINRGGLCTKAQSLFQIRTVDGKDNPRRVTKVKYRAPNSAEWQEKSLDWALDEIARRIKQTRDAGFIAKDSAGITVNRTESIGHLGGSALDNEECYLLAKMNNALGIAYKDHQARI
jgi:formate dehydrogenase major subunit